MLRILNTDLRVFEKLEVWFCSWNIISSEICQCQPQPFLHILGRNLRQGLDAVCASITE